MKIHSQLGFLFILVKYHSKMEKYLKKKINLMNSKLIQK